MRKLFLGLGLMAGTFAFSQTGPKFGIKAGMNVSSISQNGGLSDTKSKIGFNAGLFLNAPISSNFSIQPEVIYNDLGSKVTFGSDNQNSYSTNLGYISVPVMFQFNATPQFYLEAGPEFSFLVSAKNKLKDGNGNVAVDDWSKTATDNLNTFNFGLGVGLGFNITENIGINARYTAGLTKIGKTDNPIGRSYSDSKNNVFQVGLNFGF
ncbi:MULTISPECIES: porin family protein [Elizabethkingia]|uniref:Opacity protein n=2 Tax=Elizabethkingia meningoseptica TaxID=238 RepID=A0A1T3FF64_ELIME|nr:MULTISPECIES: porin family protein [Elizabethkingia]AQX13235.1 opacity protein [Elizabethkingia meningoseptica]MBG0514862.1 PorT family protein [Elizabethkingia meningoseptica]MDE5433698.1 PorT family protein [Elizabethkingia meningoseptica]MDE5482298.1 PorT family protein [Elizabethkingia meningoseptica]MDE5535531.1 PorT family protein [Elizabethkingia meningoseptica]